MIFQFFCAIAVLEGLCCIVLGLTDVQFFDMPEGERWAFWGGLAVSGGLGGLFS